jgi:penicillin-binding protein 1C
VIEENRKAAKPKKPWYLRKRWWFILGFAVFFWAYFPSKLFHDPTSTLVLDRNQNLLSAQIADDGQWRFPASDSVPVKLEQAVLHFEDEYFHYHFGINPVSIGRALYQNLTQSKVVSGGSTISMQVIRLSRKNPPRTYFEKLHEMYLAIRLEAQYSKAEILAMYISHAPYGGNVVGAETASWRYFGRPISQLSWAEISLLAVLPNAPSLMHPGKNAPELLAKRNRLLKKLEENGVIDKTTRSLAEIEPLPNKPASLPDQAFHLLDFASKSGSHGQRITTTVDQHLQETVSQKLNAYMSLLSQNEIYNACAMVLSVETGEVLAYVGNATNQNTKARFVDLIHRPRSSGSILKPFLYAKAFENGLLHPNSFVRDVPVSIGNYAPENFDKTFAGAVPAGLALSRSLNIPAAMLLREYGLGIFYEDLHQLGFKSINRPAGNYGLTLILGGAEVSLWDLAKVYQQQANRLAFVSGNAEKKSNIYLWENSTDSTNMTIDPAAWYQISEALTEVTRPGANQDWKRFSSSHKIAWKTGTSHGFRDAWAVGYNAEYLVAIWVGNADGVGRPGLTGVSAAAPLLFSVFDHLQSDRWFYKPDGYFKPTSLCAITGLIPNEYCPKHAEEIPEKAKLTAVCTSHQLVYLNDDGLQANRDCATHLRDSVWFQLDPVAGYFYKKSHPTYLPIPPFSEDCGYQPSKEIAIIYPTPETKIFLPKNFSGAQERLQLQATHASNSQTLYWHLNNEYLGQTEGLHQLNIVPQKGRHKLLVMDEKGNTAEVRFAVE